MNTKYFVMYESLTGHQGSGAVAEPARFSQMAATAQPWTKDQVDEIIKLQLAAGTFKTYRFLVYPVTEYESVEWVAPPLSYNTVKL